MISITILRSCFIDMMKFNFRFLRYFICSIENWIVHTRASCWVAMKFSRRRSDEGFEQCIKVWSAKNNLDRTFTYSPLYFLIINDYTIEEGKDLLDLVLFLNGCFIGDSSCFLALIQTSFWLCINIKALQKRKDGSVSSSLSIVMKT